MNVFESLIGVKVIFLKEDKKNGTIYIFIQIRLQIF